MSSIQSSFKSCSNSSPPGSSSKSSPTFCPVKNFNSVRVFNSRQKFQATLKGQTKTLIKGNIINTQAPSRVSAFKPVNHSDKPLRRFVHLMGIEYEIAPVIYINDNEKRQSRYIINKENLT